MKEKLYKILPHFLQNTLVTLFNVLAYRKRYGGDYKKKYQKGNWTEGMSVILNLVSDSFKIELIPHRQGRKNDSTLQLLHGIEKEEFLKRVDNLNEIIANDVIFSKNGKNI